jgi:ATP-dependent RNA helicase RhlE
LDSRRFVPNFTDLGLIEPLLRAVREEGYDRPTPVQALAIPLLLEGRDVLACAQTGTGKTAAFSLPVLQHLAEAPQPTGRPRIRALILTPTRELAAQIEDSFTAYGRHLHTKHMVIFGGVNENPQIKALRRGVDVLVATPGRLLDLLGRGYIDLAHVDFFVLDEADRMLDMGFIHDVRKVMAKLPRERQNLLFSATMPSAIVDLAASFLRDPAQVDVSPKVTTVEAIEQTVMFVDRANKKRLLAEILNRYEVSRAIVFTRTKHGANRVVKQLHRAGIESAAIHGNKSQRARERALEGFRDGSVPFLIATDIASRGIDVEDVSHVVNYDLPNEPESYVHRIGRTGRAGRAGVALSFCDETEGAYLRSIERLIGFPVQVDREHRYHHPAAEPPPGQTPKAKTKTSAARRAHTGGGAEKAGEERKGRRGRGRGSTRGGERTGHRTGRSRAASTTDTTADPADAGKVSMRPVGRRYSHETSTDRGDATQTRGTRSPGKSRSAGEGEPRGRGRRRRSRRRGPRDGGGGGAE